MFAGGEDLHDVGVKDSAGRASFDAKPLTRLAVAFQGEELERRRSVELGVEHAIDDAARSPAEQSLDAKAADGLRESVQPPLHGYRSNTPACSPAHDHETVEGRPTFPHGVPGDAAAGPERLVVSETAGTSAASG